MNVVIPNTEWREAYQCTRAVGDDDTVAIGYVHLYTEHGRRWWIGSDGVKAVRYRGGEDTSALSLNIPTGAWYAVSGAAYAMEDVRIIIDEDSRRVSTRSGVFSFQFERLDAPHPGVTTDWEADPDGGSISLEPGDLQSGLHGHPVNPVDDSSVDQPVVLSVSEDGLGIGARLDATGYNELLIKGEFTGRSLMVRMYVNPLHQAVMSLDPNIGCTVTIPMHSKQPVHFSTGNLTALVMPLSTDVETARRHVETVIDSTLGFLALRRDSDGDYPLRRHGLPIYGRLVEDGPVIFQVFAVVLQDVEESPELLKEINSLNAGLSQARIFHVEDQVLAEVDLVASSLDDIELTSAIDRIQDFATSIAPTLRIVHGGDDLLPPEEERWNRIRGTVITAEVAPGLVVPLSGADGTGDWPFPGSVFVITGWNPQGVNERGDYANSMIAADVLRRGGRLVLGETAGIDGEDARPSVVAWGIDLEDAREFGRRASQDTIFEVDAEEVTLVACFVDRTESWPRNS